MRDEAFTLAAGEDRSYTTELGRRGTYSASFEASPDTPTGEGVRMTGGFDVDPANCQDVELIRYNQTVQQEAGLWSLSTQYAGGTSYEINCYPAA